MYFYKIRQKQQQQLTGPKSQKLVASLLSQSVSESIKGSADGDTNETETESQ